MATVLSYAAAFVLVAIVLSMLTVISFIIGSSVQSRADKGGVLVGSGVFITILGLTALIISLF